MAWDAELYHREHRFIPDYGKALIDLIPAGENLRILDLGCGTGELTEILLEKGSVIGVDGSPEMINKARSLHPRIVFEVADACRLPYRGEFDVVFSNAVFHWISDQTALLGSAKRVLKPGGRLICEFGGAGNIRRIQEAFEAAIREIGLRYSNPFYFPEPEAYGKLLTDAGFRVECMALLDRPTPLGGGREGLRNWTRQFFFRELEALSPEQRDFVMERTEALLEPTLWRNGRWVADYKRLRVVAIGPD